MVKHYKRILEGLNKGLEHLKENYPDKVKFIEAREKHIAYIEDKIRTLEGKDEDNK